MSGGGSRGILGRIDPLPTMFRDVSGRHSNIAARQDPDTMHRNQKIQGQPATDVRLPPRTGPMLGAVVTLATMSNSVSQYRKVRRTRRIPAQRKSLFLRETRCQRQRHVLSRTYLVALRSRLNDCDNTYQRWPRPAMREEQEAQDMFSTKR